MSQINPLVSIGMPVYNGERYVAGAIQALLQQDYPNLEIIICDNASTDATQTICQQYAQTESRIRYVRNERNIGASNNFNKAFQLSNGEFFMWAAYDDLWEKTLIRKCVEKLMQYPQAIMCLTEGQHIDEEGKVIGDGSFINETIHLSVAERLKQFFLTFGWHIYGIYRSVHLRRTNLLPEEYGPDVILAFEMHLLGGVVKVNEKLFFYRIFQNKTHYNHIEIITTDPNKQREMSRATHTKLLKNLYTVLQKGNVPPETLEDFLDSFVFHQKVWVKQMILEHPHLFHIQLISPDYVREFLQKMVSTHQTAEQIASVLGDPMPRFQQLVAARPIFLVGSPSLCAATQELLRRHHIHVHGMIYDILNSVELTQQQATRPFVIIASEQPHILEYHLNQKGYKHRQDFLQRDVNLGFVYLS